jgi:hypothetical protein
VHPSGHAQAANFKIGRCVQIKPALIGSHLGWGTIAVPSDEPSFVVASGELDECGSAQLFDGVEGCHPQQVFFQPNYGSSCVCGLMRNHALSGL